MKTTLTILIHGEPGVGKSWTADTAPAPRLILDAEGRSKYTPSGPKVTWDPTKEEPPEPGEWTTCVVHVTDFDVLQRTYEWLRSGKHPFRSVVVDSLMEVQKRCVDKIAGVHQLTQQQWGELLRRIEALVRSYRDLTMFEQNSIVAVVAVCGTTEAEPKRPLLQGQARTQLPYFFDIVGYMYTEEDAATGGVRRVLAVAPYPGFIAKDNTGAKLPPVIADPNIEQMLQVLRINGKAEQVIEEKEAVS